MLIKCKECDLQVSDKAIACPHCGYPLKNKTVKYNRKRRRRLPNGFGQITEVKQHNLRKPFRAMITVGKNENGRPICKPLKPEAYFETYNAAYEALVEYNHNPYDLEDDITVKELYDRWSKQYFETLTSQASLRTIQSAWKYCSSVYDLRVKELRARHIKHCMYEGTAIVNGKERTTSDNLKPRIKSLFNLMLDYALEYELVDKNYARTFSISSDVIKERDKNVHSHIPYSDDELRVLWDNMHDPIVRIILMQCYSGWRPKELLTLELNNVDLEGNWFVGGMKTESGKNRKVPICKKIRELVNSTYEESSAKNSKYLISCEDGSPMTYDKYQKRFVNIIKNLNINPSHRPHDGRNHFITSCKMCGVDEYAIKYMVGHKISDITESVYTKREFTWLQDEIDKLCTN